MGVNRALDDGVEARTRVEDRDLRVILEIERDGSCPMDDFAGDVIDVDVRFEGGHCYVDAVVREGQDGPSRTKFFSEPLCEHCPGTVFARYDCLPRYRQLAGETFVVETYAPDTETVSNLVADIREVCPRVSVRSIVSTDDSKFDEVCAVDVSALTNKQREALYHAQQSGYYDPSVDTTLAELAEQLDVSTSALSQRLKRAEANVIDQVSLECSCLLEPEACTE